MKHTEFVCLIGGHPLLGFGYAMTAGADSFMKGYGFACAQEFLKFGLVMGHRRVLLHLEDGQWEHPLIQEEVKLVMIYIVNLH